MAFKRNPVYKGKKSEVLDPIEFEGYTIKVLKHGNTGNILYCYPRKEDFEPCWTMDLETAKKGIIYWQQNKETDTNIKVESNK
jgi:hypothetical protein